MSIFSTDFDRIKEIIFTTSNVVHNVQYKQHYTNTYKTQYMSYDQTVNSASYYCLSNLSQINLYTIHRAVRRISVQKNYFQSSITVPTSRYS